MPRHEARPAVSAPDAFHIGLHPEVIGRIGRDTLHGELEQTYVFYFHTVALAQMHEQRFSELFQTCFHVASLERTAALYLVEDCFRTHRPVVHHVGAVLAVTRQTALL